MSKKITLKITKKGQKIDDERFSNIVTKSKQIMKYNNKKMISVKHIKLAITELFNIVEAKIYIVKCKKTLDNFEDGNIKPINFKNMKERVKKIYNSRIYDNTVVFLCGLV
jgi:hypothetical protein